MPTERYLQDEGNNAIEVSRVSSHELAFEEPRVRSKAPPCEVACVSYLRQERKLYLGLTSGEVKAWELLASGRARLHSVGRHKGDVTVLHAEGKGALGVPGGILISGSCDFTIKLWEPRLGRATEEPVCFQTLYGHRGSVTALVCTAGYLVSGSTDRTLRVWRAVPGREALVYPWFEQQVVLSECCGWVASLAFARSRRVGDIGSLFCGDGSGAILRACPRLPHGDLVLLEGGELEWHMAGRAEFSGGAGPLMPFRKVHDRGIKLVKYLPDEGFEGTVLAAAADCTLRIFDVHSASCSPPFVNPHNTPFTAIEYDEPHAQVLLADGFGYLFIFDIRRLRLTAFKRLAPEPIVALFWSAQRGVLGACFAARLEFWHVNHDLGYNVVRGGHTGPVIALHAVQGMQRASEEGRDYRVLSASQDNTLRLWEPADMACQRVLRESRSEITAMAFMDELNLPVTGHDDGTIRLWQLDTGSTVNMREHHNSVSCLVVAPVSKGEEVLVSGGFDGHICVWEVRRRHGQRPHLIFRWPAHRGSEILAARHDPIRNLLITAGNDAVIKVWSARTYALVGEHTGHAEAVTCLALDANFLFSGSEDCSIKVWDLVPARKDGGAAATPGMLKPFAGGATIVKTFTGHKRAVTGVEILPLSGHLVSCGLDGRLLVWDYLQGVVLRSHQHNEEFRCLALRVDADEVVVGTMQSNVLRFPAGEPVGLPVPGLAADQNS